MGDSDDDAPIGSLIIKRKLDTNNGSSNEEPHRKKKSNWAIEAAEAISSSASSSSKASSAPSLSALNDEELPEWWDDNTSVVTLMERRNKHLKEQAAIRLKKLEEDRKNKQGESKAVGSKGSTEKKETKVKKETPNVTTSDKGRPQGENRAADYYDTLKGQIVQTLLVRWWYAYEWPTKEEVSTPPSGYEELEGFRGIFVSMNLDSLVEVLDLRNKANCPSLKQMSKRPCKELQELCIKALRNQTTAVKEAEGDECALVRTKAKYLNI